MNLGLVSAKDASLGTILSRMCVSLDCGNAGWTHLESTQDLSAQRAMGGKPGRVPRRPTRRAEHYDEGTIAQRESPSGPGASPREVPASQARETRHLRTTEQTYRSPDTEPW